MNVKVSRLLLIAVLLGSCSHVVKTPTDVTVMERNRESEQEVQRELEKYLASLVGKDEPKEAPASPEKDTIAKMKFNVPVDTGSVTQAIAFIQAANEAKVKGILIEINSPGGSVDDGFDLSKAMEESTVPIICVVDGQAQSMAEYILQACPVRLMTKRSFLMIHEPGIYRTGGQSTELALISELLKAMNLAMVEHLTARSKIKPAELAERIKDGKRWYLGWEEALNVGFVDGVVLNVKEAESRF